MSFTVALESDPIRSRSFHQSQMKAYERRPPESIRPLPFTRSLTLSVFKRWFLNARSRRIRWPHQRTHRPPQALMSSIDIFILVCLHCSIGVCVCPFGRETDFIFSSISNVIMQLCFLSLIFQCIDRQSWDKMTNLFEMSTTLDCSVVSAVEIA